MDVSNQDSQLMVTLHYSSTFFQVGFPIFVTNIIWQNDVGFKISCIKNIFEITSNLWCSYHTLLSKCCLSETLRLNNLKMKRFSLVFMFCTFCVNSKKRHFNEASIILKFKNNLKLIDSLLHFMSWFENWLTSGPYNAKCELIWKSFSLEVFNVSKTNVSASSFWNTF